MPEWVFRIFEFCCYFFRTFLPQAKCERNSGLKFFSLFLGLSLPVPAKNNAGMRFFEFFSYFFRNFLPRASMNGIRDENFFPSFSAYLIPFWQKIIPERGFFNFWIFYLFFTEFPCPGWVWTEFGPKIFFSFSRPI